MKKLLVFSLLALAVCAQAATVKWNWKSDAVVKFDSTSVGANATAYLLYIGDKSVSSYTFNEYVDMAGSAVATASTKVGKVNTSGVTVDATPGNFVTMLSYVSGSDTYWNVSSSVYTLTQAGIDDLTNSGTPLADSSFSFSNTVKTEKGTGTVGGGWAMVPEPSTAALALAGLALLIKRRRA